MNYCFVHAADLHLDTPFQGLARVSDDVARTLRDASLEAFDQLVELAVQRGAAFVLLAGDIYDGEQRGLRAQLHFLRGLQRLDEHAIHTLVIHGNHDPLEGWSAIRAWPDRVHVFGSEHIESVSIERDGRRLATVHGVSFARSRAGENPVPLFRRGDEPGLHVGLLHCNAIASDEHDAAGPCTAADLRAAGMDYWALGHIHKRQTLHEGNPWIVYPGNLQGRSPKPSESEPKGAVVAEVADGRISDVAFEALDGARFVEAALDIGEVEDAGELSQALDALGEKLVAEHAGRHLIVRVRLEGSGPLHRDLSRDAFLTDLRRDLRQRWRDRQPIVWWDQLVPATAAPVNLDEIRRRDDFASQLVRLVDELLITDEDREQFCREELELLDSLPGDPVQHRASDEAQLLEEARTLALSMLDDEQEEAS